MVSALEMSSDISGTSHCVVWRKEWQRMNQACGDIMMGVILKQRAVVVVVNVRTANAKCGNGTTLCFRSSHSPNKAQIGLIIFSYLSYYTFDHNTHPTAAT